MHFHRFGKWEDVKLAETMQASLPGILTIRETIIQQRRCEVCNLVRVRTARGRS